MSEEQTTTPRIGDLTLAATVARRYFLQGQTKVEIASDLRLSRFKVARLLDLARTNGLVRVSITDPGTVDAELSDQLRQHLGLDRAIVVNAVDGDQGKARDHLASLAASLLEEMLSPSDVLGLAWSRSVLETAARIRRLPGCDVVQLSGALARPDVSTNLVEAVERLARVGGGRSYAFYSPLFVSDPASVEVIGRQPEVAAAVARFPSVTTALVGIGCWQPASSTLHDALLPEEREALLRGDVLADVSGTFLDASGSPLPMLMSRQVIGIDAAILHDIPRVVSIASGREKAPAVRIAVRAGYVNTLVTTAALADELLAVP